MEFWIVEEGEKRGPFQAWEIRERIERGELEGEELAWHRDCAEWSPLKELEVFRSEFERTPEQVAAATPPPLPQPPRPFLRFWARWFDLFLYSVLVYGFLAMIGVDLREAFTSPMFTLLHMLPWVLLDALMIHIWKTTPGKFLLGIRVVTGEEGNLELGDSLVRAVRVFILGMGFTIWLLPLFCNAISLWFTFKNGKAPWDAVTPTEVKVAGPFFLPVVVFMCVFAALVMIWFLLVVPPLLEIGQERAGTA